MSKRTDNYEDPDYWESVYDASLRQARFAQLENTGVQNGDSLNPFGIVTQASSTGDMKRLGSSLRTAYKDFIPSITVYKVRPDNSDRPGIVFHTSRVLFNNVSELRSEAASVMKTFAPTLAQSETFVQFYGEQPRVFGFSGTLFNSKVPYSYSFNGAVDPGVTPDAKPDADWYNSFLYAYENLLRGSKSAEAGCVARVSYAHQWRQGYIINFTSNHSVDLPNEVSFQFSLLALQSGTYLKADTEIASSHAIDAATSGQNQDFAYRSMLGSTFIESQ